MAQLININDIKMDMILAEPVTNKYGQTLLPSGTILDKKKQMILKTWNVKAIVVKSDDNDSEVEITEEMITHAREGLFQKMQWKPKNECENDLLDSVALYLAKAQKQKEKD